MDSLGNFAVGSNDARSNIARGNNFDVDNEEALSLEPYTCSSHELLVSLNLPIPT